MKPAIRIIVLGPALLCAVLAVTDASAQFGGAMGGGMRRGAVDRSSRSNDMPRPPLARPSLSERLDQLNAQLLLTPDQERPWARFRAAFMALQQPMSGGQALPDTPSALQAMQQQLSQAQEQVTRLVALSEALAQLDQGFNPQQRAVADRLLGPLLTDAARTGVGRDPLILN